jgi:DeoR/GlpR family transcriptional regulator of sugar metabolism
MSRNGHKELAASRWERLRAALRQQHVMRVEEICRQLAVSPATARRDLEQLEERGEIRRVHGGAVLVEGRSEEPLFDAKTGIAIKEKQRIARAALEYVKPGETIYLDGGSTVLELARLLHDHNNLTVVTNSLRAAWELAGRGPKLILIGGELRRLSQTVVGPLTRLVLEGLHLDRAFMGTIGVAAAEGMTKTEPSEAFTKELVMRQARQVVLLADSSKAGKVAFARAGSLEELDVLITDAKISRQFGRELEEKGVKLVKV